MRLLGYLLLLALIGFGLWPYYSLYRLDAALAREDDSQLAAMVDLTAIRANYKQRVAAGVDGVLPSAQPNGVMSWIRDNLQRLGDSALDQAVTLPWVRDTLREAIARATGNPSSSLLTAVDFAFFESYDRFLVRLGELGQGATHVRLSLIDQRWTVTDIIP